MMENKALCHFAIARRMQKEIFKNSHKMECNKVKMDFTGGINLTLTMLLSFEQKNVFVLLLHEEILDFNT